MLSGFSNPEWLESWHDPHAHHLHPQCNQDIGLSPSQMNTSLNWHTTGVAQEGCGPGECDVSDLPNFF